MIERLPTPPTVGCFVCGGDHSFKECPRMRPPSPPLPPGTNPIKEETPRSSLAITQFEEIFGDGAEGLLQDVLERPDVFTKDQRSLAEAILGGEKTLRSSDGDDRALLDNIAYGLAVLRPPTPKITTRVTRPTYVRTRAEMEDFDNQYSINRNPR